MNELNVNEGYNETQEKLGISFTIVDVNDFESVILEKSASIKKKIIF